MTDTEAGSGTAARSKAEMVADDLIDRYSLAADTLEGVRSLLMIAYLEGSMSGSDATLAILRGEVAKLSAPDDIEALKDLAAIKPESLRA